MSELKSILQWVSITNRTGEPVITHQFDEEGNQLNINKLLDLSESKKLDVMIGVPINQRVGTADPIGNPFIAIDMKTGLMNINGTNWDFRPTNIDPSKIHFRPVWYHSIRKDYAASGNLSLNNTGNEITLYKIGWQFTYKEKNYQRILFYDVKTGIFSLKEKR